jgi:hypothetical protein
VWLRVEDDPALTIGEGASERLDGLAGVVDGNLEFAESLDGDDAMDLCWAVPRVVGSVADGESEVLGVLAQLVGCEVEPSSDRAGAHGGLDSRDGGRVRSRIPGRPDGSSPTGPGLVGRDSADDSRVDTHLPIIRLADPCMRPFRDCYRICI